MVTKDLYFFFPFPFIELSKKNSPGNIQPTKLDYFTSTVSSYCKFHSTLIKPFLKYISRINAKLLYAGVNVALQLFPS